MRLIDLDKVRWKDGFYDMHTGEQYAPMIFNTPEWLEWAVAEAEVEAIPIEWIKGYITPFQEFHDCLSEELQENDGAGWVVDVLETMLREWERENETNRRK